MKNRSITVFAPAKINLFLDIGKQRDDGYHELKSVMQTVSLYDKVTVTVTEGSGISLVTENADGLSGEKNIAYHAARMYIDTLRVADKHIDIIIEKHIPIAAGLGGGSTDAAAVLLALNSLFGNALTNEKLLELGLTLGADLPFCISGGTCIAKGVGEMLYPCTALPDCHIVLTVCGEKSSTGLVYKQLDEYDASNIRAYKSADGIVNAITQGKVSVVGANLYNAFECVSPIPEAVKNIFRANNALGTSLSGSGPSVFGLFNTENDAIKVSDALKAFGLPSFIVHPCHGAIVGTVVKPA